MSLAAQLGAGKGTIGIITSIIINAMTTPDHRIRQQISRTATPTHYGLTG
jgi:hypothetical protein